MRNANAVDAAHVAGGASGHEHIPRGQCLWRSVKIQQVLLCLEENAVL